MTIGAWTAILPWSVLTTEDAEFGLRVGDGLVHKKSKFRVVNRELGPRVPEGSPARVGHISLQFRVSNFQAVKTETFVLERL